MFNIEKLNSGHIYDLEQLLSKIPPREFATTEEMEMTVKIRGKMKEAAQPVVAAVTELAEFLKPMRDAKATDAELDAAGGERFKAIMSLREAPALVELSDEQAECFRKLFKEQIKNSIVSVDAYLMIADAIGLTK